MVTRTSFVQIGHGADHQGTAVLFGGRFRQFTWVEACLARRTFPRPHFADARDALSPQRRSPSSTRSTTTCCKATRSSSWPTQSSTQWKKTTPANKAREWFPWTGRAKMPVSLRRALLWTTKRNSCVFMACSERRYALARHFSLCGSRFFRFEWPSFGDCMVPMPSDNAIYKKNSIDLATQIDLKRHSEKKWLLSISCVLCPKSVFPRREFYTEQMCFSAHAIVQQTYNQWSVSSFGRAMRYINDY